MFVTRHCEKECFIMFIDNKEMHDVKLFSFLLDAEEPENGFFFVASVTAGVDADGGKFSAFTPSFDSKWGHS